MSATDTFSEQVSILSRLDANWNETDIAHPNVKYEPTEGTAYIRPVVNHAEAFNADIATSRRIRHPGMLTINIYYPLNEGTKQPLQWADDLAELYRNVTFDGITFRAPTVRDIGRDGSWYRVQVDCPYWRDSIH